MFIKLFDVIFPVTERFGDQLSQLYMLPFTHFTLGKEDAISTVFRHLALPYRKRNENGPSISAET